MKAPFLKIRTHWWQTVKYVCRDLAFTKRRPPTLPGSLIFISLEGRRSFCLPWQPAGRSTCRWRPPHMAEPPLQLAALRGPLWSTMAAEHFACHTLAAQEGKVWSKAQSRNQNWCSSPCRTIGKMVSKTRQPASLLTVETGDRLTFSLLCLMCAQCAPHLHRCTLRGHWNEGETQKH